jgi:hypothetical protein
MFLRDPARIEALLCCHFIAMLIQALIAKSAPPSPNHDRHLAGLSPYPEDRGCAAPTAARVLEIFAGLARYHLRDRDGQHLKTFQPELTDLQRRVLDLPDIPQRLPTTRHADAAESSSRSAERVPGGASHRCLARCSYSDADGRGPSTTRTMARRTAVDGLADIRREDRYSVSLAGASGFDPLDSPLMGCHGWFAPPGNRRQELPGVAGWRGGIHGSVGRARSWCVLVSVVRVGRWPVR